MHPGCSDPGTNGDDGEAAIDVEMATSIAPSAAIENLACPSGTFTFDGLIALQNLINASGPYPGVVSVSYGICEAASGNGGNAAFYNTYQQAAAQGLSVFVSSGDDGGSACGNGFGVEYNLASLGVTGWGSSPYNVSVGGTDFEDVYNAKTGQNGGNPLSTYWNSSNSGTYGSAKSYIPEIPWNDSCASTLISEIANGTFTTYGSSGTCNTSPFNTTSGYISLGAGSGGASNCATGAGGINTGQSLISQPGCQGWAKPSYQTGAALSGGQAVYGMPSDGVRDIPDVSMFAANGALGTLRNGLLVRPGSNLGGRGFVLRRAKHLVGIRRNLRCYSDHGGYPGPGQSENGSELGQSALVLLPNGTDRVRDGGWKLPGQLVQFQRYRRPRQRMRLQRRDSGRHRPGLRVQRHSVKSTLLSSRPQSHLQQRYLRCEQH